MMRQPRLFAALLSIVGGFGLLAWGQSKPTDKPTTKPALRPNNAEAQAARPAEAGRDEADVADSAKVYEKLYNAHDAKGLAALFAVKAEITDEAGVLIRGREAIEAEFQRQFEAEPKSSIAIEVANVRLLTPNIALEEGRVKAQRTPEDPASVSNYTCIHVRVEGEWKLASVTDTPAQSVLTPHDHLQELSWFLGDWVNESPEATVHTRCEWHESGNFLLNHFAVQFTGRVAMHGTTRIGWDAVARQFRSWTFDSEGGFAEGLWIPTGDEWVVKMSGSTPDGETCSSTNVYRILDQDTFTFRSYDRIINGTLTPAVDEVVIKRRAPAPVE